MSLYRHFARSYWNSCSSYNFIYSTYFIKYSTWSNNEYPIFGRPLPRTHRCFCRSYCKRFVEKYTYPYFPTTTGISWHCFSPCFYWSSSDPSGFKCLKSISAETNLIAPTRYSLHFSSCCLQNLVLFGGL